MPRRQDCEKGCAISHPPAHVRVNAYFTELRSRIGAAEVVGRSVLGKSIAKQLVGWEGAEESPGLGDESNEPF
jgi:hypothetical protein